MPHARRFITFTFALSLLLFAAGCSSMMPGTQPVQTFRLEEPEAKCSRASLEDLRGPLWSDANRSLLRTRIQDDEPTIASILGCNVEVLDRCHANGRALGPEPIIAKDLGGECTGATHVVRAVGNDRVHLSPLSLGQSRLTGTFHGVLRQPGGPYQTYDLTMYLAQDGTKVTGVTRIATLDQQHWGDFLLEGRVEGNILFFRDVEILDEEIGFGLEWCAKGGYLVLDARDGHLTGPATAPACAPGTLDLRRIDDHPTILLPRRTDPGFTPARP